MSPAINVVESMLVATDSVPKSILPSTVKLLSICTSSNGT